LKLGKINDAIIYYKKALELSKPQEKWIGYSNIANAYFLSNSYDDAIAYFHKAIESNRDMSGSLNLRISRILLLKGKFDDARKYYDSSLKAIETSDLIASQVANSNKGIAYGDVPFVAYNLDDINAAITYSRKYMEAYGNESSKLHYSIYLALTGSKKESLSFSESIDKKKCDYLDVAELYVVLGNDEKAIMFFNKSYEEAVSTGTEAIWTMKLQRIYPKDNWKSVRNEPWFRAKVYSMP